MFILYILVFFIVLATIIVIHELGHYFFARRYNVLVHEFSLGMGPVLYQKEKDEINYSVRALPIGGYVSMSGEGFDELISVGNKIGLILDENNMVNGILLDNSIKSDVFGEVINFDFSGENEKLFIEIKEDDEVNEYILHKNTRYYYKNKKQQRITLKENSFEYKTIWQRFMIVFAGPLFNFILAFLLLFIVGIFNGKPMLDSNKIGSSKNGVLNSGVVIEEVNGTAVNGFYDILGKVQNVSHPYVEITLDDGTIKTVPLRVAFNSIGLTYYDFNNTSNLDFIFTVNEVIGRASASGLKSGDVITHVQIDNNNIFEITNLVAFMNYLETYATGETVKVTTSDNNEYTYSLLSLSVIESQGASLVAFDLKIEPSRKFDFIYMFTYPFNQMGRNVSDMFKTLGLLFNPNSGVGVGDLAGPIGIYALVQDATTKGIIPLLIFSAFLSVNIGIINLFPIPALDGGRILFLGYELVTRRKVNRKFESWINLITFVLLLLLILYVSYNDILRL